MASALLYLFVVLIGILPGVQNPLWYLAPTAIAPVKGVWVFLEDPDATPPVLAV